MLEGTLHKMITENLNPIRYFLNFDHEFLDLNGVIGRTLKISHIGNCCNNCKKDKEIYAQGYCKQCFFIVPQTNESIMKPELSTAHLGIERKDLEWEKNFELQPHIVYLSLTSGLKVGVTRDSQIPTRWIDQGAKYAIKLLEVENRYLAGISEVAIAKEIADKTNYRRMLTGNPTYIDLVEKKHLLKEILPQQTKESISPDDTIYELNYPIEEHPEKVKSITLKKNPSITGRLKGIKGQYLIFESGEVFNVRNHEGFVVNISFI